MKYTQGRDYMVLVCHVDDHEFIGEKIMSEQEIEKEIQEKDLNAPRLTPTHIDNVIEETEYHVFEKTQTTVACIRLRNGFSVIGESACASPENFDAEIGRKIAFENARRKIWALEGYLLKQELYDDERVKEFFRSRHQHKKTRIL